MFRHRGRKYLNRRIALAAVSVAFATRGFESNVACGALVGDGQTELPVQALLNLPSGDSFLTSTGPQLFTGTTGLGHVVFTGSITSSVYIDPAEPDIPGNPAGLDFVYVISNDPSSTDEINQLTVSSFSTFLTGIDYVTGSGTAPTSADRLGNGRAIDFYFDGPTELPQGGSSDSLLVETNAQNYGPGFGSAIDGGSGTTAAVVPVSGILMAVPEPASFAVITLAGGFLLSRRRRK